MDLVNVRLQLGVCPNFLGEFQGALAELGFDDVAAVTLPTSCIGASTHRAPALPPDTERRDLTCSGVSHDDPSEAEVVKLGQCFHLVAGKALVNSLQREGGFVVTPGWVRNWLSRVREWGFERAHAREFFAESMKQVVLLDTGIHPDSRTRAAEFAAFVGLPLTTLFVGLDHLKTELSGLVGHWRLQREKLYTRALLARSQERLAELSMALELLRELSGIPTEAEAVERIVEVLTALFGPRQVELLPFTRGVPGALFPAGAPAAVRPLLAAFQDEFSWVGDDSFVFRLATRGETVAVVRLHQLAFPSRRDDYSNLARSISEHCAVALLGARSAAHQRRVELELRQAHKLESVGRLAAGLAHEINTPVQYIGDNVAFVLDGLTALERMTSATADLCERVERGEAAPEDAARLRASAKELDLEFFLENAPQALRQSVAGLTRIATIVKSMREFAHPTSGEQELADLNHALQITLEVARNEFKYVADVKVELGEIPLVLCYPAELNQVFLNLIVNAAHAVADVGSQTGRRGLITVRSWSEADMVVITVQDTGTGIRPEVRDHVFEQFFTTRAVGQGTGQGLSMAWRVVERHGGLISFDTVPGEGTTFRVRLPSGQAQKEAA
ncbi:MAG: ATP-binding protein [Archangium sp.]|nr:ATP-binding protein [Archangium sp.]